MKCSECKAYLDPDDDWNCHEVADCDCENDLTDEKSAKEVAEFIEEREVG